MGSAIKKCTKCGKEYFNENDFLVGTNRWRVCAEGNLWFNCSCDTSLMIPKGQYSWYSPDKFMRNEVKSVFNLLSGTKEFPHIPTVIMELQNSINDENVDAKELARLVRFDPFLAADTLRIASNLKNLKTRDRMKIKSLEHSIVYIGRRTLKELIVVASITSFKLKTKKFSIDLLMQSSVKCAGIAEALSRKFNPLLRSDEVYLAAYLANLGKIVSAICFPEETDEIYAVSNNPQNNVSWIEAEKKFPNIDHCVLGEIGASIWGLPKYVGEAARLHHAEIEEKDLTNKKSTLFDIVNFANLLTPWFYTSIGYCDDEGIYKMAKNFGLDEQGLDELVTDLRRLAVAEEIKIGKRRA